MQAKGRLQCWNADGQELGGSCRQGCAGKGQVATLEQHRLTARLGGSCRTSTGRMSEKMSDRMSEDMPDRMPDRMPERMSERMSEDMPD